MQKKMCDDLRDRRGGDTGVLGRSIVPTALLRPINQIEMLNVYMIFFFLHATAESNIS